MFSARNIHFIILGLILGGTSGYIFAFYQVQSTMSPPAVSVPAATNPAGLPPNHPDVSNGQMVQLFKEAIEKNPKDAELMTRYGNFLFDQERFKEAVAEYEKVLAINPKNPDVRTDMATALWNLGESDRAMTEYEHSLKDDPRHLLTHVNLFLAYLEGRRDIKTAESYLRKMEEIDASYPAIPQLKEKLEEAKKNSPAK